MTLPCDVQWMGLRRPTVEGVRTDLCVSIFTRDTTSFCCMMPKCAVSQSLASIAPQTAAPLSANQSGKSDISELCKLQSQPISPGKRITFYIAMLLQHCQEPMNSTLIK